MLEISLQEELRESLFSFLPLADWIEDRLARLTRLGPCWSCLSVVVGKRGSGVQESEAAGETRVGGNLASPGVSEPVSGLKGDLCSGSQRGERDAWGFSCEEKDCCERGDCWITGVPWAAGSEINGNKNTKLGYLECAHSGFNQLVSLQRHIRDCGDSRMAYLRVEMSRQTL